ncbi:MAG: hypothetical protein Q7S02_01565 [bacterium]|nr:hypothetical protein [bacterium]
MIDLKGGNFARCRKGGTLRVRAQVLAPPAAAGGPYAPVEGEMVRITPIDSDAFAFHDGAGTDEKPTDRHGNVEFNVDCAKQGTCRLALSTVSYGDAYLDVEVDLVRPGAHTATPGGAPVMIVDRRQQAAAPAQPIIVLVD